MAEFVDRYWSSADGLRLHARDYFAEGGGGRTPVICLHGLTRNARDFEDLAPLVAGTGRRVLTVDVRGRGKSAYASNPLSYAIPAYVADVQALLAATGLARAGFIGTSMGGLIAMALATVAPDAVAGVLLNDIGPEVSAEGLGRILSYAGGGAAARSWEEAVAYTQASNAIAFPAFGPREWEAFTARLFRETGDGWVLDYDPEIMAPLRQPPSGDPPPDLWPLFEGMAKDRACALVRGATSDVLTRATAERMQTLAPHMLCAEVSHVGHAPMLTEPEAQAALYRWLDRLG